MPLIQITTLDGKTPEQVQTCLHEVTQAVMRSFGSKPESVRVIIQQVPHSQWAVGGVSVAELDKAGKR
jgi:4-oxalocrotonate tautomerase